MSGILGVWNLDGRPIDSPVLEAMAAAIAYRGPDGRAFDVNGPVGLGALLMRVTPESAGEQLLQPGITGSLILWDGRLDDRAELLAKLARHGRSIDGQAPDPELVLAAYEELGDRCFSSLVGDFAFAIFDPRGPELFLCRDRIGMRTVAYTRIPNGIVFASDVKAVMAHPEVRVSPNDELIAELIAGGWPRPYVGETFFRDIFDVAPSHVVRFGPDGTDTRRYWSFDPGARIVLDGFEEYAEAFREVFERSVRRRLRSVGPVAILLSGGLDSSSVACLASRLAAESGAPAPFGIHVARPAGESDTDGPMAALVERSCGIAVQRVPIEIEGFRDHAAATALGGETPFPHPNARDERRCYETALAGGARVLVRGYGGDQLVGGVEYLADLVLAGRFVTLVQHLRELPRWNEHLRASWYRRWLISRTARELVPVAIVPSLRRLRTSWRDRGAAGDRYWSDRLVRLGRKARPAKPPTRRGYASRSGWGTFTEVSAAKRSIVTLGERARLAAAHGLELVYPFYDHEVVAFAAAIPGEMMSHRGVHRALERHAMASVIPEPVALRKQKGGITRAYRAAVMADAEALLDELRSSGGAVDADLVIEPLVAAACARAATGGGTEGVENVFALDAWTRTFFGQRIGP